MIIELRAATLNDCKDIAKLYRISSDGVADYIWSSLAEPYQDILEVGKKRYERENCDFSYRNCTIVEVDRIIAGMMVAFPMYVDDSYIESDPVLIPYSKLEENQSYYICGIALYPHYRSFGIGTQLLGLAERNATELGLDKVSLIVFEQNYKALRLYKKLGYLEVARERIVPHPLIKLSGNAILMVKKLSN